MNKQYKRIDTLDDKLHNIAVVYKYRKDKLNSNNYRNLEKTILALFAKYTEQPDRLKRKIINEYKNALKANESECKIDLWNSGLASYYILKSVDDYEYKSENRMLFDLNRILRKHKLEKKLRRILDYKDLNLVVKMDLCGVFISLCYKVEKL
jgi:hypothetical protein